jgi:hypothetical protein
VREKSIEELDVKEPTASLETADMEETITGDGHLKESIFLLAKSEQVIVNVGLPHRQHPLSEFLTLSTV